MVTNSYDVVHYPDTGCELAPSCLNCHRERCWYDELPMTPLCQRIDAREQEIRALRAQGWKTKQIANHMSVSRRTVERALEAR